MNFRRGRRVVEDSIDITPLVDVVFLLLIFLLVSTQFKRKEYSFVVRVPKVSSKAQPTVTSPKMTVVLISGKGKYQFVERGKSVSMETFKAALSLKQLRDRLATFARTERKLAVKDRQTIYVRADKDVKWQHVADIIGVLKELRLETRVKVIYQQFQMKQDGSAP